MSTMQSVLKGSVEVGLEQRFLDATKRSFAALVTECKTQLATAGWTVVTGIPEDARVRALLVELGTLLPQYTGEITYEVKALPGFEAYQYSQSANTIQPHTEAPVYAPPPKYLALHCRRQARCGAGQTLLADGFRFVEQLPAALRAAVTERQIDFAGFRTPGTGAAKAPSVTSPVLSLGADGQPILRFSYNVFRFGNLHPTLGMESGAAYLGEDAFFRDLCAEGTAYFEAASVGVLVPDGGILIFDNHRMLHARSAYRDTARHLTRYWIGRADSVVASGEEE